MKREDLIEQAVERLAIAIELLHQLWAVQSFEDQHLVPPDETREHVVMLVDEYLEQTDKVSALIGQYLEETIETHVRRY
jgi:hypothetical protein